MAATPSDRPTHRLAVLIDADNAQAAIASELLAEVARHGNATVRRAYGDWTTSNLNGWKDSLLEMAIQPVQQFRFTVGKNATDSALIIDAMDLLHGGSVDGFCLVSSDSDFTRLATRIREAGLVVYGFGAKMTPKPFVAACDRFVYTETLRTRGKGPIPAVATVQSEPIQPALLQAVASTGRDGGWASLAAVGSILMTANPSFDPRSHGYRKLGDLVKAQPYLEVKTVAAADGSAGSQLYVRRRDGQPRS